MAAGPITSWQIEGEKVEAVMDFFFFFGAPKVTADVTATMKLKDTYSLHIHWKG